MLFEAKPWGGRHFETLFGRSLPPDTRVGCCVEVRDAPGISCRVAHGPLAGRELGWLVEQAGEGVVGRGHRVGGRFPLEVQWVDVSGEGPLDVGVGSSGAVSGVEGVEFFYAVHAESIAVVHAGLLAGVERRRFLDLLRSGRGREGLRPIAVGCRGSLVVPSGCVHGFQGGCVLVSIRRAGWLNQEISGGGIGGLAGGGATSEDEAAVGMAAEYMAPEAGVRSRERLLCDRGGVRVIEQVLPAGVRRDLGGLDRAHLVVVVAGRCAVRHQATKTAIRVGAGQTCLVPAAAYGVVLEADEETVYLVATVVQEGIGQPALEGVATASVVSGGSEVSASSASSPLAAEPVRHRRGLMARLKSEQLELANRLMYFPFLRLLLFTFWFRVAVVVLLVFATGLVLFLPRIWGVTPEGFLPRVRISGLDWVQAHFLRRTGERAMAEGQWGEATRAWQAAFANHPGDPELLRGMIRVALADPEPESRGFAASIANASWLLRLTGTNQVDLELTARLYAKARRYDLLDALLTPMEGRLSADLKVLYAKTLFHVRKRDYASWYDRLDAGLRADPELALHQSAYLAGWGPPETAAEGKASLEQAWVAQPALRPVIARLQAAVAVKGMDLAGYSVALRRLGDLHLDGVGDHTRYWRLLVEAGRKDEAVSLAAAYVFPPRTEGDLLYLADALVGLEQTARAQELLRRYVPEFAGSAALWIRYGDLALATEDWEALRAVATQMRAVPPIRAQVEGVSYYYEGRVEGATGRAEAAERAFARAAQSEYADEAQARRVAASLLELDYFAEARILLDRLVAKAPREMELWALLYRAGLGLRDEAVILRAAEAAHGLAPRSGMWANRYVFGLWLNRIRPDEAIRLSMELTAQFTNTVATRISHAGALVLNRRPEEAQKLLLTVRPDRLEPQLRNDCFLVMMEACVEQLQWAEAEALSRQINPDLMFPKQREVFESLCRRLAEAVGTASGGPG